MPLPLRDGDAFTLANGAVQRGQQPRMTSSMPIAWRLCLGRLPSVAKNSATTVYPREDTRSTVLLAVLRWCERVVPLLSPRHR